MRLARNGYKLRHALENLGFSILPLYLKTGLRGTTCQRTLRWTGHRKVEINHGVSDVTEPKEESVLKRRQRPIMSNTVKKFCKMNNQKFLLCHKEC